MSKFYMAPLSEQVGLSQTVRIDSSKKFIDADITVIKRTVTIQEMKSRYLPYTSKPTAIPLAALLMNYMNGQKKTAKNETKKPLEAIPSK